jgi:hypothetical protein
MNATIEQLEMIEKLRYNFCINVIDYGFYSDGTISVLCCDNDKDIYQIHLDKLGKYINIKYN